MQSRHAVACIALASLVACSSPDADPVREARPAAAPRNQTAAQPAVAEPETLGFVVSAWRDEIPAVSPEDCPDGFNVTELEYFEIDEKKLHEEIEAKGIQGGQDAIFPPNACRNPTAQPDPGFKTFDAEIPVAGLDLDGVTSKRDADSPCAHQDFESPTGQSGIDNQHWRLYGCTKGYQPGGLMDRMYRSGNFTREGVPILFEIRDVDDRQNDDHVEVRIFSSADHNQRDGTGEILRDASMRVHDDPRYHSDTTTGRIQNGVLTTDPVDVRIRFEQQVVQGEFYYRDLRVRADLHPDGRLTGLLGLYWDAENMFRVSNDHSGNGRHTGRGAAIARGYMCAGVYHAAFRLADGHPDPETGRCTSVSAAIHFEAVPAFVIGADPEDTDSPTAQTARGHDRPDPQADSRG